MKIYPIGGYNEVGKNMTAVELNNDDVIIFDGGLYLPPIVELEESEKIYTEKNLRSIGAIPDDLFLDKLGLRKKVRAILPSHAHLDHIGALPYLAQRYNAPIVATPFTIEVLKSIYKDERNVPRNKLITIKPNGSFTIKGKHKEYKAEFVHMTHSTIHTAMIAVHTDEGVILYGNDYKLDNTPTLGQPPNYKKLKELAKEGIKVFIIDSLYSGDERKTASERVAKTLLEEVVMHTDNKGQGLIVSTFSSHIARLNSIVEYGKKLNRKVIFLGRSINKYVRAADRVGMCPFRNAIELATYRNQLEKKLRMISKNRGQYMIVCTGHQGEPGSILDRLAKNKLPYQFNQKDNIVFSSSIIPTEVNIENREKLDIRLKRKGCRLFNNVHVSGHGGREDLRDLYQMLSPEHIIPSHGELAKTEPAADLAYQMGFSKRNVHLTTNKQTIEI